MATIPSFANWESSNRSRCGGSPPAPPQPPPDQKLLAAEARAQADQTAAAHKAQLEQQKAQADTIHQQGKIHAEIELAKIKAGLDAKIALFDAHLKAMTEQQKIHRSYVPGSRKARTAIIMFRTRSGPANTYGCHHA